MRSLSSMNYTTTTTTKPKSLIFEGRLWILNRLGPATCILVRDSPTSIRNGSIHNRVIKIYAGYQSIATLLFPGMGLKIYDTIPNELCH